MYNVTYTVHSPFLRAQEGRLSMSAKTKLTLLKSRRKGSALIKAQLKPLQNSKSIDFFFVIE